MKTFMTLCIVVYLAQCAYFDQLPIDPTLSNEANQAINFLLTTLKSHLDCSLDDKPRSTRSINNHLFNYIGSFGFLSRRNYIKNGDRSAYSYSEPLWKNSFCGYNENYHLYRQLKRGADVLAKIKKDLMQYNNVIVGSANRVKGKNNVVIGSNNTVGGDNFWVFDSNVEQEGIEDGCLSLRTI